MTAKPTIAELKERLAYANLRHDVSPWGMGEQYRREIREIEAQLRAAKAEQAAIEDEASLETMQPLLDDLKGMTK